MLVSNAVCVVRLSLIDSFLALLLLVLHPLRWGNVCYHCHYLIECVSSGKSPHTSYQHAKRMNYKKKNSTNK